VRQINPYKTGSLIYYNQASFSKLKSTLDLLVLRRLVHFIAPTNICAETATANKISADNKL
jgi:hypothetical protein